MASSNQLAQLREQADRILATVNSTKPSKAELAELRKELATSPDLAQELGDLGKQLQHKVIEDFASKQPGLKLVIEARAKQLGAELGYEQSTPLERTLITHAVLCWLQLQAATYGYQNTVGGNHTLTMGAYWDRRLTGAQRRYLKACETLARVRRLLRHAPAVQVNIAQQQIVTGT